MNSARIGLASSTLALSLLALGVQAAPSVPGVVIPAEALSAPAPIPAPPADAIDAKVHAQLRAVLDARARGSAATGGLPATLLRGDQALVEVTLASEQTVDGARDVLARHGATLRHSMGTQLHEAWMPLDRLRELAQDPDVARVTPARLVQLLSNTSEGVAAGNSNYWQTFNPSYTGTGVTIAVIDSFENSKVSSLISSGDWPTTSSNKLTCYNLENAGTLPPYASTSCTGPSFGAQHVSHGDATLELAFDMAPGASYRAYDVVTSGDWYDAIRDAANVSASGTSQGAVRANVISASLSSSNDSIGDGTAIPGSIAEAAGYARNQGVLVVNAAGNERQNHWGGAYTPSGTASVHTWSGANTIYNFFSTAPGSGAGACIPAGTAINVSMYWNDWVMSGGNFAATHDYDLYLFETNGAAGNWTPVAQSNNPQTGAGKPTELIQYVTSNTLTSNGCATGSGLYAIQVVRTAGTTATDNLQVFAHAAGGAGSFPLNFTVPARSLVFPADSPSVVSVAAIDVANSTSNPQEPFSSEGPVLASGGGIPASPNPLTDTNLKPDMASFDDVTTATLGATKFLGTSASTPYVAGMAAQFMQRAGTLLNGTTLNTFILTPLRTIASTGSNDLGTAGRDYQYGYGRLRFQKDSALAFIQQPSNTMARAVISPTMTVGIYDNESKLMPYTLFDTMALAIANDPNGGAAALQGSSVSVAAGIGTFTQASIDLGGTGYTLKASISAAATPPINLSIISNPFNITTGAPSKLFIAVQPANVQRGVPMSPGVQVDVEDSAGNVVNSNSSVKVTLTRVSCSSVVPVGGGPLTVVKGVVTFNALELFSTGTASLQATASGLASATSTTFIVTNNTDIVFRGGFETCIP